MLRRARDAQADHESGRRKALKSALYRARSALVDRMDLSGAQRREQLSATRVARLEAEAALRVQIAKERDALKGDRAKAGALRRDMVSVIVARERRIPSLEA